MQKAKRITTILLVLVFGISMVLSGCGGADNTTTEKSSAAAVSSAAQAASTQPSLPAEPEEIRVLIPQFSTDPVDVITPVEKYVEDKLMIKFTKIVVPGDSFADKEQVMLASGGVDLMQADMNHFYGYINKGLTVDLAPYLSTSLSNYKAMLDKPMNLAIKQRSTVDGKVYGLFHEPYVATKPGQVITTDMVGTWTRTAIRSDWLEACGLQAPTTPDELYNVLKAFYDKDPGKVGQKNLNIYTACLYDNCFWCFASIFGAFGVSEQNWRYDEATQKVTSDEINPKMKDALAFVNKLYKANLIDKDFAVQKEPQLLDKIKAGTVGFINLHQYPVFYSDTFYVSDENIEKAKGNSYQYNGDTGFINWEVIPLLKGPDGASGGPSSGTLDGWPRWIPRNGKNLDAVLRFFNWLCSEEAWWVGNYGIKDQDYTWDGTNAPQPGPAVGSQNWDEYKKAQGIIGGGSSIFAMQYGHNTQPMRDYPWASGYEDIVKILSSYKNTPIGTWGRTYYQDYGWENASLEYWSVVDRYALSAASQGDVQAKLASLKGEYYSKIINGTYSIDKFDEFVQKWKQEGGDKLSEEFTADYHLKVK